MSRHGYIDDDWDDSPEAILASGRWVACVKSAMRGKRGQAFLRELAAAMDAMPVKALIAHELINERGECCTIGVVCKARGIDVSKVDYECPEQVGAAVGIARQMAAEIEYENDDGFWDRDIKSESPEARWQRMRKWVESKLTK